MSPAERADALRARGRELVARQSTAQLVEAFRLSDELVDRLRAAGTAEAADDLAAVYTSRGWLLDELDARDSDALERHLDGMPLAEAFGV